MTSCRSRFNNACVLDVFGSGSVGRGVILDSREDTLSVSTEIDFGCDDRERGRSATVDDEGFVE